MRSTLLQPGLPISSRCWRWLSVFVIPALIALSLIPTARPASANGYNFADTVAPHLASLP